MSQEAPGLRSTSVTPSSGSCWPTVSAGRRAEESIAALKALKTPVLIITGDADVSTLEHSVAMFRLLGGGGMGDMGKPLASSRLAVLPATSHTAVINQVELLTSFIEPFLNGVTPKGFME